MIQHHIPSWYPRVGQWITNKRDGKRLEIVYIWHKLNQIEVAHKLGHAGFISFDAYREVFE